MRRILPFFFLAMMVSWGCHRKSPVPAPAHATVTPAPAAPAEPAPKAVTPPPEETETAPRDPIPEAKEIPEPDKLELGEMYFKTGKYQLAAKAFEDFLNNNRNPQGRDRAWFYLGLSRILDTDSSRDPRKAENAFRQLIKDFPDSIYKSQATFILNLLNLPAQVDKLRSDIKERDERIKKLSDELKVLKEIDLQRRPSRPKE